MINRLIDVKNVKAGSIKLPAFYIKLQDGSKKHLDNLKLKYINS